MIQVTVFSVLKVEAERPSETLVPYHINARRQRLEKQENYRRHIQQWGSRGLSGEWKDDFEWICEEVVVAYFSTCLLSVRFLWRRCCLWLHNGGSLTLHRKWLSIRFSDMSPASPMGKWKSIKYLDSYIFWLHLSYQFEAALIFTGNVYI
jgi:hypothetical protein